MQIENLNKLDVATLELKLGELKKDNPDIIHRTFNMDALKKGKQENEMLQEITDKLDRLERKLDLIFGDHVLHGGTWIYVKQK